MKIVRTLLAAAVAAPMALAALPAQAQSTTFYLDRAQLSGAPSDGFMVWRPYMYDETRFYGSLALGYQHNPLRDTNVADDSTVVQNIDNPVQGMISAYAIAGMEVAKWVGFNVAVPVALYQFRGEDPASQEVGNGFGSSHVALHDVRLDLRARLYDSEKLRLGFGGAMWVPSGNEFTFTGDAATTGYVYGAVEYDFKSFFLAGTIGPHFRPDRGVGNTNGVLGVGSELRWALGGYVPINDDKIRVGAELFGTTGLGEVHAPGHTDTYNSLFAGRNTALEWLAQARFMVSKRSFANVGGGTRLTGGYGAPDFRILASIGTFFTIEDTEPDSPSRGFYKGPEVADQDKDTDGDGYPDSIDACPTVKEDGKPPDPTDGCPAGSDRDGDGIPDIEDACPDVPEDKDGIEDNDGCPEEDADNDKIPDVEDACPTEPGPRSKIAEKNGCPSLTKVTEGGEVQLLEPIQFEFGKATIKPVSFPILDEVVTLMDARPEIRMGVYGHTDSVGSDAANLKLSKDRAASVLQYLVKKGIKKSRLESEGYGETKPLKPNTSAANRAINRRVEFKILAE